MCITKNMVVWARRPSFMHNPRRAEDVMDVGGQSGAGADYRDAAGAAAADFGDGTAYGSSVDGGNDCAGGDGDAGGGRGGGGDGGGGGGSGGGGGGCDGGDGGAGEPGTGTPVSAVVVMDAVASMRARTVAAATRALATVAPMALVADDVLPGQQRIAADGRLTTFQSTPCFQATRA